MPEIHKGSALGDESGKVGRDNIEEKPREEAFSSF